MKKFCTLFCLIFCLLGASAQKTATIGVIPTPQKATLTEGTFVMDNLFVVNDEVFEKEYFTYGNISAYDDFLSTILFQDDTHPTKKEINKWIKEGQKPIYTHAVKSINGAKNQEEAYRLTITPNQVDIYATTLAGLKHACSTLIMLHHSWNGYIPCMDITDWPAFKYRGWLDDISRGPIPTESFVNHEIDCLGHAKLNFFNLYTEHTFYNPEFPDISPLSAEPLNRAGWGKPIEYMANLQCFAHFEETLKIPFYQNIADTKYNLNPASEESYTFLKKQIDNIMKTTGEYTQFFNINCDETESLGGGKAREYVDRVGADEAYCRHINRVYDLIKPYGKKVLMWGDIVGKNPEMLKKLPADMQYIVWSYGAKESYNDMIAPFQKIHRESGNEFWVAPGCSHWSSIPQVSNYMQNIAYLARDGYKAGAIGLMNTAWDDSGESLFADSWHAMLWGAEMAWHPIENSDPKLAKEELEAREKAFNEAFDKIYYEGKNGSAMIYAVGGLAHSKWIGDWFNTGALMQPLMEFYPANVDESVFTRCDSVDAIVNKVLSTIDSTILPHFTYACHRILCASEKSRLRVLLYRAKEVEETEAAEALSKRYFQHLHDLKREYLRLWDEECTEAFRDEICGRYDRLGKEVQDAFYTVQISTLVPPDGGTPSVMLSPIYFNTPVYYTLDGRTPTEGSLQYAGPFDLEHSCLVKAVTFDEWGNRYDSEKYLTLHKGMGFLKGLNTQYSDYNATYSGGGENALADGELGNDETYADGHWQGYWGCDIDAVYDFGKSTNVKQITMRFLQNTVNWVLAPKKIEVYTSKDGKNWTLAKTKEFEPDFRHSGFIVHTDAVRDLLITTRYLRVVAKNPGPLPEWHPSPNQPSYLFCDEIVIE